MSDSPSGMPSESRIGNRKYCRLASEVSLCHALYVCHETVLIHTFHIEGILPHGLVFPVDSVQQRVQMCGPLPILRLYPLAEAAQNYRDCRHQPDYSPMVVISSHFRFSVVHGQKYDISVNIGISGSKKPRSGLVILSAGMGMSDKVACK